MTDLPRGWASGPLSDFIQPRGEKVSPASFPDLPFVGMDHVEAHTTKIVGSVAARQMKSNAARFSKNDVLYGRLRPYLNKVAQPQFDGLASAEFIVFRGNESIDPGFLRLRLNSRDFVSFASHLNEGDRPRVNFDQISDFEVSVPPIDEQRRIVGRVETLFEEIDRGVESLRAAKRAIGLYRKSLLKSAFEGRLTAAWRAENPDKLESPEALLARIREERERRHREALDEWERAVAEWSKSGRTAKKPRKPRRLPEPKKLVSPGEFDISWATLTLNSLGRIQTGATPPKKNKKNFGGNIPFFKPSELDAGPDVRNAREFLSEIGATHSRRFSAGTVLITCIGTIGKVGMATVGGTCNQQINYVEPDKGIEGKFLYYQFLNSTFQNQIKRHSSSTTLPILNKNKLSLLPVCICSPAEQAEIVRILDTSFEAAEALEAEIAANLARADALRQSILKKAFAGKLVPQDPADEPTSVLLARIERERARATARKRRKRATA